MGLRSKRSTIVTGAGGGTGRLCALALAAKGADVRVNDIRREAAEAVAAVAAVAAESEHSVGRRARAGGSPSARWKRSTASAHSFSGCTSPTSWNG